MKRIFVSLMVLWGLNSHGANVFYPIPAKIVPDGSEKSSTTANNTLHYFGGPIIEQVKVVTVFWGNGIDTAVLGGIGGFYSSLVNSTHMDAMQEYNTTLSAVDGREGTHQIFKRGSYLGEIAIIPSVNKPEITDEEIHKELEQQIAIGVLPIPDKNTLFMIHFAPGIRINMDGMRSCMQYCAYHYYYESAQFGPITYGVMPDFSKGMCAMTCSMGSAFDSATIISSHEFFEAITDPYPTPADQPSYPQAWNTTQGAEIGDMCNSTSGELRTPERTYKVQGEWSNKANKCATGPYF